jgi:hypothetical protein
MMDDNFGEESEHSPGSLGNNTFNEYYHEKGLWTSGDLIKAVRYLTDNFSSFKNVGGQGGIKVPTIK